MAVLLFAFALTPARAGAAPLAVISADKSVAGCDDPVTFSGAGSQAGDPNRAIVKYEWDFDYNGSSFVADDAGISVTYAYLSLGTHKTALRVTDNGVPALVNIATMDIQVMFTEPPIADAGGPYTITESSSLTLDGTASNPSDAACGNTIVSYEWDLDNDGAFDDATGAAPTITAAQLSPLGLFIGTVYTVRLRVLDAFGVSGTDLTTITVATALSARFTASSNPAACDQAILFDASGSTGSVSYQWNFGDGAVAAGVTATHAYSQFGSYTATLTVTDNSVPAKSATASQTIDVSLGNLAPVALAGGPYVVDLGETLILQGSGTDPNAACGDSVSFAWDLDNDRIFETHSATPPVTGDAVGLRPIALRATDAFGLSSTAATSLTVYDNRPQASFSASPNPAGCNQMISFDGSSSSHGRPDRSIVSYSWNFGDGTSGDGALVTHAYSQFGSYTATLTVTDDNFKSATASKVVDVSFGNLPPIARAGGPYTIVMNAPLTLDGTGSSDPNSACGDSIVSYEWDVDNDGAFDDASGASPTLSAAQVATFGFVPGSAIVIRLRVVDAFGAIATATSTTPVVVFTGEPVPVIRAIPTSAACGQSIEFDGSSSIASGPGRAITQYQWEFGDGASGSGATVNHVFSAFGTYTARLTVTDDSTPPRTATTTQAISVSLGNEPPVAKTGGPYTVDLGSTLTLNGSASDPNESCGDSIVSFAWDLDGDDSFETNGAAPAVSGDAVGSRTISLRATDAFGISGTATTSLTVYDNRPLVSFSVSPNEAGCTQMISFDGTGSSHGRPDRSIVSYSWNFGDGTTATGAIATHAYSQAGSFTVTLTVTDTNVPAKNATASTLVLVSLENLAPIARAGGPYTISTNAPLALDGSGSSDPNTCGDSIIAYGWDLDDDGAFDDAVGATVTLSAADVAAFGFFPGRTIIIRLRVMDAFGASSIATTTLVITGEPIPVITALPNPAACGQSIEFDGSSSMASGPGRTITQYQWEFGDGGSGSGATVNHVFSAFGTYTALLTVTDDSTPPKTAMATQTISVSLGNEPPVANTGGPYSVDLGSTLTLNGSASDPNESCGDSIVSFAWDLDNDGVFETSGATPTVSGNAVGIRSIAFRVTDEFGLSAIAATTLSTYDNRPVASFSGSPDPAGCNQMISFDATGSSHGRPDRAIVNYSWSFGDGSTATGETAMHAYSQFGSYTVTLTVTDNNGPARSAIATHTVAINLGNVPPIAEGGGPYEAFADYGTLTLDGSASSDPNASCGDSIVMYEWDLDNDGAFDDATGAIVQLSPTQRTAFGWQPGSNPIALRVRDEFGAAGIDPATVIVRVNLPPHPNAGGPYAVNEGGHVALAGTALEPDGDPVSFAWDFDGDGTFEISGAAPVFSAAALDGPIVRTVTLRACDDKGACATASASIVVSNAAPVIDSFSITPSAIAVGGVVTATTVFHDAGTADTHTVTVDWGDGTATAGTTVSHSYSQPGLYTARVSVVDDDADSATASDVVAVANLAASIAGAAHFDLGGQRVRLTLSVHYRKNETIPLGPLRLETPQIDFRATAIDWLVVDGNAAYLVARDQAGRQLLVSAIDATRDLVRIRLSRPDGSVELDSQPGASDVVAPTTPLIAGSLVVKQ